MDLLVGGALMTSNSAIGSGPKSRFIALSDRGPRHSETLPVQTERDLVTANNSFRRNKQAIVRVYGSLCGHGGTGQKNLTSDVVKVIVSVITFPCQG